MRTDLVEKNIEVPLIMLYPHAKNYRGHPPDQIKMLKASLERYGQVRSIVCKSNEDGSYTIVAGHGLVLAAQELVNDNPSSYEHLQHLRADIIPNSWDELDIRGYIVSDNNINQHSTDDDVMLAEILQQQQDAGYDLASLGTDDETLRQMLDSLGNEIIRSNDENRQEPSVSFKEYDESIADNLDTELCNACGKLCLKDKKGNG